MSAFKRDAGMSTRVCLAVTALRIRDSMSAIGSVIFSTLSFPRSALPAALRHAGDVAFQREFPEAKAAERELPHVSTRAAAQVAAVAQSDLELRLFVFFRNLGGCCHKRLF